MVQRASYGTSMVVWTENTIVNRRTAWLPLMVAVLFGVIATALADLYLASQGRGRRTTAVKLAEKARPSEKCRPAGSTSHPF